MNLKLLSAQFAEHEIEWRIGQCGTGNKGIWASCLAYIQARAIMDRLDEVCGPGNWTVKYRTERADQGVIPGVIARIGIKIGDEWVYKEDGAEQTEIEPFKGGMSGALKRAGAAWGIGRYLYDLDAGYADVTEKKTTGSYYGKTKDGKVFYWTPPKLPAWALPPSAQKPAAQGPAPEPKKAVAPKEDKPMSRHELGLAIMQTAGANRITPERVAALSVEMFKAPLKDLSRAQMETLHKEIM